MILTGLLIASLLSCSRAQSEGPDQAPLVVAAQGAPNDPPIANLLPEIDEPTLSDRGRSDIEIEAEEPPRGYFYPRPAKPFNLPAFKPLSADEPLLGSASFAPDSPPADRPARSPRRRPPVFDPIPPFVPGFIPPHHIRPLPALYGRPPSAFN